ncbi:Vacuolar protein sorting-associated protein 36 [Striga hermonthica]|uniref:Vacuolar protein-sorting-associated protein 36 n=1 Tax=Striga hermonthica TaxID=68872 RepID=A0A9N7RKI8_STRHE|nr:Vacuolar protein sorting-associated protein 36 [Striga hermonthica]
MAGALLPAAKMTASGRPVLKPGEVECSLLSAVDLLSEDSPTFPNLKSGILILTTHRLLWLPPEAAPNGPSSRPCFIPLSAVQHIFSTKKSIKSMFHSPRIRFQVSATAEGAIAENGGLKSLAITLIVRGKTDPDPFLAKFWEAWRGMAWEAQEKSESGEGSASGSLAIRVPVVGVAGILRKEQELWESTDKNLQDAFQDLNALMSKAKEMVMLAEKMRLKLLSGSNNQISGANDDEMGSKEEMQDWLLSVGIVSPVTKETAGALYHQQLSRQLADFVKIPLERAGGMINLIDVYCLFNRARGTELISPDDLLQASSLWEKFDVSVMLRKFDSGVMVIQSKTHSDEEVFARIRSLIMKPEALRAGISASDAAMTLGVAPAMAKEYLLAAEGKGLLCRDVSPDGFRFYINLFLELYPENLYTVKDHSRYSTWIGAVLSR